MIELRKFHVPVLSPCQIAFLKKLAAQIVKDQLHVLFVALLAADALLFQLIKIVVSHALLAVVDHVIESGVCRRIREKIFISVTFESKRAVSADAAEIHGKLRPPVCHDLVQDGQIHRLAAGGRPDNDDAERLLFQADALIADGTINDVFVHFIFLFGDLVFVFEIAAPFFAEFFGRGDHDIATPFGFIQRVGRRYDRGPRHLLFADGTFRIGTIFELFCHDSSLLKP